MARQVIERVISDLTGKEIPPGKAWQMTLTPPDGRRNPVRLDISEAEAQEWISKGTEVKRRGRRPGTTTRTTPSGNGRRKRGAARKTAAATRAKSGNGRRKRGTGRKTASATRASASANGRRKRGAKSRSSS